MKKLIAFLLFGCMMLVSSVSFAAPAKSKQSLEVYKDVGLVAPLTVTQNEVVLFDVEKTPITPISNDADVGIEALLLPTATAYIKRKFTSHNRRHNLYRKHKYGKDKNITSIKIDIDKEKIVPLDYIPSVWQLLASNVKDQS